MPITFTVDLPNRLVRTRIDGPLRSEELTRYMTGVLDHEDYEPGLAALVQCHEVELVDV